MFWLCVCLLCTQWICEFVCSFEMINLSMYMWLCAVACLSIFPLNIAAEDSHETSYIFIIHTIFTSLFYNPAFIHPCFTESKLLIMRKFSFSEEMQEAVSCYFGMLLPVLKTQRLWVLCFQREYRHQSELDDLPGLLKILMPFTFGSNLNLFA